MQCPSCQNKEKVKILEKVKKYKIIHCLNCNLYFSDPIMPPDRKWYEKVLVNKTAMVLPQVWHKWQKKIYNQFLERRGFGKTLLDVGCGDGEFIKGAQEKGYRVTGIDFNRFLISKIKEKYNLEVYPMSLEEFALKFPQKTFDVITFFEVLEHISNPNKFLALVKSKLKSNGHIALSVPNRDRFRFGLKKFPEWDSPPHHFTWWDDDSLKKFLILRDFEILEFKKFKKTLKFRIKQKDGVKIMENRNRFLILKQLSPCGRFKYLFYERIIAPFLFKVTNKKIFGVKINVEGPYLYAFAKLRKK